MIGKIEKQNKNRKNNFLPGGMNQIDPASYLAEREKAQIDDYLQGGELVGQVIIRGVPARRGIGRTSYYKTIIKLW
jgi:hypothetical protein